MIWIFFVYHLNQFKMRTSTLNTTTIIKTKINWNRHQKTFFRTKNNFTIHRILLNSYVQRKRKQISVKIYNSKTTLKCVCVKRDLCNRKKMEFSWWIKNQLIISGKKLLNSYIQTQKCQSIREYINYRYMDSNTIWLINNKASIKIQ